MPDTREPEPNRGLGYVRTLIGTVRFGPHGIVLFATRQQLEAYANQSGRTVDAEAVWVELDNAGRVLEAFPNEEWLESAIGRWVDRLLGEARAHEVEELFFRGYTAGLKASKAHASGARDARGRAGDPTDDQSSGRPGRPKEDCRS